MEAMRQEEQTRIRDLNIGDEFYFGKTKRVIYKVLNHLSAGTCYHQVEYIRIKNKTWHITSLNLYVTKI